MSQIIRTATNSWEKVSVPNIPGGHSTGLLLSFLLIWAMAVFSPCLHNDFVNMDDPVYITDNPDVKSPPLQALQAAFSHFTMDYSPLTVVSFSLEHHFFQWDPRAYHATNVLLHLVNIGLVFWLVFLLSNHPLMALAVAACFGLHPLRLESVAWACERKDLLFAMFYLAGVISYLVFTRKGRPWYFLGIPFAFFLLSCFSKSTAISFPLLLLALDYFDRRKPWRRLLAEKIPFILVSLVFLAVNLFFEKSTFIGPPPPAFGVPAFSFLEKFSLANFALDVYLFKAVVPHSLSLYYAYPQKVNGILPWDVLISPFFNLAALLAVLRLAQGNRNILLGATMFLILIALPLGVPLAGKILLHDRFTYLSHVGLFLSLGGAAAAGMRRHKMLADLKRPLLGLFLIYLAGLSIITFQRTAVWKNSLTLWSDVLRRYPDMSLAYYLRGSEFLNLGRIPEARNDFDKAVALSPEYPLIYVNRAVDFSRMGKKTQALQDLNLAVILNPKLSIAYYHRANVLASIGYFEKSLANYDRAIELDPDFAEAYNSRGIALAKQEKFEPALRDFGKALALNPRSVDALNNRGYLFLLLKRYDEALENYRTILLIDPGQSPASSRVEEIERLKTNALTDNNRDK